MSNTKRVNILVYSGTGTTVESVRHVLYSLRRLCSPNYAVIPIQPDVLIKEPWPASCALLVFPGGADLGYCKALNGNGNRRINQYVNMGGSYLGFCAGGYYGCSRCEFEVGDKKMQVVGDRELGFFPGICRGLAFPGFVYNSEAGARAPELKVHKDSFQVGVKRLPDSFRSYYNGGGVFVDAEKLASRGVEVLASYTETLHVEAGPTQAAVVFRKVGEGRALLTGPHPEFAGINITHYSNIPDVIETVKADDAKRSAFLRACLQKLGLTVNEEEQPVPSLSRLHLSSQQPQDVAELVSSWQEIITLVDDDEYIKGENDTFVIEKTGRWGMQAIKNAITDTVKSVVTGSAVEEEDDAGGYNWKPDYTPADRRGSSSTILDFNKILKRLVLHETDLPNSKETPNFNHNAYFANLAHYNTQSRIPVEEQIFGKHLLYGEVVTSTNTLLEKNNSLLKHLPPGFTATATTQIAGRGRGSNVWVSPPGSLMFSTVLRHPLQLTQSAPVIFVQYIVALAIVAGIKNYEGSAYSKVPVRLKWPNDIYALDPSTSNYAEKLAGKRPTDSRDFCKIGGILVNSSYDSSASDYTLVVGVGLNVSNAAPTTSLNLLASSLTPPQPELQLPKLLASILVHFQTLYAQFCRSGWDRRLETQYYEHWLHGDQIVELETEGGVKAKVKGITKDWGLLLAEELGWEERPTGRMVSLQSDSNSFDFFKGLVKRKV